MEELKNLEKDFRAKLVGTAGKEDLENLKREWLGEKGRLRIFFQNIKSVAPEKRGERGRWLNEFKKKIEKEIDRKGQGLSAQAPDFLLSKSWFDITVPVRPRETGHCHLITLASREIISIFRALGFELVSGPEIETEWHNFDALNIPETHPAKELSDTFWLKDKHPVKNFPDKKLLLRTHTSPTQIRYMEKHQPPFRIISLGKVYRFEAIDASHNIEFYQLEGLFADKETNFANLKNIVETFLREFFRENKLMIRWVPSYYPFVEPGVDVLLSLDGKKWLEVAGAGMVHPQVFKNVGYPSGKWQGFAFGIGIDRLVMLKYGIPDLRLLQSADLRFLKQFN